MASTDDDIDAEAEELLERTIRPKRRARPRLAHPLHDAEGHEVETPDGAVTAWRLGAGPATLLVHGWEDDNALWGPLIDRLQANGRSIVALDLPGHGYSAADFTGIGAAGAAVKAVAEALGPIDSVVGHSFGCVASLQAVSSGLTVDRAVLIASPLGRRDPARAVERFIERGVDPDVATRAGALMAERQTEPPFDIEAAAAKMTAKGLVIHALDDDDCEPGNASLIVGAWPGAELLWVDGLGHRRVAQDDDVLQRVADFVDGFG